jgi:hypothetical protein
MSGSRCYRSRASAASLFAAAVLIAACSSSSKPAAAPPSAQLWGDMTPIVSVKELMRDLIDPLADNIFESVSIIVDGKGTVETIPKTDDDWARVRIGGVTMAEASYLLKVRRPFAPPGEENNSTGPEAVEFSPARILAKVERDPVEWNARIQTLRNVGLQVLDIVNRKAADELWDASENLDTACENCHLSYWYPGQTQEYWDRLDRRLREYRSKSTEAARTAKPTR